MHASPDDAPRWRTLSLGSVVGFLMVMVVLGSLADIVVSALHRPPVEEVAPAMTTNTATTRIASVDGLSCTECHNVLTDDGYVRSRVTFPHAKHQQQGMHCQVCHDVQNHTFATATTKELCATCHTDKMSDPKRCKQCHADWQSRRPLDHRGGDWRTAHGRQATSAVPVHSAEISCTECHDKRAFCGACHRLDMPHTASFKAGHSMQAYWFSADCMLCHTQGQCGACHTSHKPESHQQTPFRHWDPKLLSASRCQVCHASEFCSDCHTSKKPPSHTAGWKHSAVALAFDSRCLFCHQREKCDSCHGLALPHPKGFLKDHATRTEFGVCDKCHPADACRECHSSVYPKSHRASDWRKSHGSGSAETCERCHKPPACTTCHGIELPHPADFSVDHGKPAYDKAETCARCHHDSRSCMTCHQALKPKDHGDAFLADHTDRAKDHKAYCFLCHSFKDKLCVDCHSP